MCFYWESLKRQVCIAGEVSVIDSKEADEYYNSRPYESRIGAWASSQSNVMKNRNEFINKIQNSNNLEVIHFEDFKNAIDIIEKFKPDSDSRVVENRIVTTASADIPLKGLRFLINALPRVLKDFPQTHLMVIGKSPNESKIRKLIDDLGLKERISFKSNLSEEKIVDIYRTSQIAVIPSLYEGFGFGAGEAMACGTPLISTDSGGLKDVIGDSAIKIASGSIEEIENTIISLFQDPEKREQLSLKGRNRMEDLFDWKISASKYVKVFEEIINIHKSANN